MNTPVGRKILYIQHAAALGGSVISLKEVVVDAVNAGHRCVVVCPNREIGAIYERVGASVHVMAVPPFNHNTALFYKLTPADMLRMVYYILKTCLCFFRLSNVIKQEKPDVVHLNSATLVLYNLYFRVRGIPCIFHVREVVVKGYLGLRRWFIRKLADSTATCIIYISEFERSALGTRAGKSFVIYNYVHLADFLSGAALPAANNASKFTLVTVGGLASLKGGKTLLESMTHTAPDVELLVLGSQDPRIHGNELSAIEGNAYLDETLALLKNPDIGNKVRIVGKVHNVAEYIRAADALVFIAASPHFPRPVFEAWLLKKPVLYYNPAFISPIINADTVFLISQNSAKAIADTLNAVRITMEKTDMLLQHTYELALEHFTERNFQRINELYTMCVNLKSHGSN